MKINKNTKNFLKLCAIAILAVNTTGLTTTNATERNKNEVYLGTNTDGVNVITQHLRPNSVYKFPLLVSVDSLRPVHATATDLEALAVSVKPMSDGNSIRGTRVISENGLGFVEVYTGCDNYFDNTNVNLNLSIQDSNGKTLASTTHKLEVGYDTASNEVIETLAIGDAVVVNNNRPIYTEPQLNRISEIFNHEDVTFVGKIWNYTNSIDSDAPLNMHWNTTGIPEILNNNPDAHIKFLSFPAEPKFSQKGRLEIDTAISPNGSSDPFLYRYAYGKLYPLGYEYDSENDRLVLSPSELSTYVLSDRELTLN